MRPTLDSYFMKIAEAAAERSTCTRHFSVGAVATIEGRVLMTGYNGVPAGMPHCDDSFCVRLEDGKHAYLLHAEENLIAQSSKNRVSLVGATVYLTHQPCSHCMAIMAQAGIRKVVFKNIVLSERENAHVLKISEVCNIVLAWLIEE